MTARTSWHTEASLAPTTRTALGGIVDDVVIGGGVVGLSAAVELVRRGRRVALVEAHPTLGAGTSGRSTGKLSLLQGTRLSTIETHHGTATSARYVGACREAQTWVEQLLDHGDVDVPRRPAVTWASDGDRTADTRAEDAAARRAGLPTRWQREVPAGPPATEPRCWTTSRRSTRSRTWRRSAPRPSLPGSTAGSGAAYVRWAVAHVLA